MRLFSYADFYSQIKDVDKDLCQMALFDLGEYLATATQVEDEAVDAVLQCLSEEERNVDVWNDASLVIPRLTLRASGSQLRRILSTLLEFASLQKAQMGDAGYSQRSNLCGDALKRAVAAVASQANSDVHYMQQHVGLMEAFVEQCAACLSKDPCHSVKECVYGAITPAISAFGASWGARCLGDLLDVSFRDFKTAPQLQRTTTACVSALLPHVDAEAFHKVQTASIEGFSSAGRCDLAYALLCEAEVCADPFRMRSRASQLATILVGRVEESLGSYDTETDVSDGALKFLNLLLQTYPRELEGLSKRIVTLCSSLSAFDPNHVEDGYANAGYEDDYYDNEYDNYYTMDADDSWKLRMWSLRVMASIISTSTDAGCILDCVAAAKNALDDRTEDVRLEAMRTVDSTTTESFERNPALLEELCNKILRQVEFSDKEATAALHTLDRLFRTSAMPSGLVQVTAKWAESHLASLPKEALTRVRAIHFCQTVLKRLVALNLLADAGRMVSALVAVITPSSAAKTILSAVRETPLYVQVSGAVDSGAIAEQAITSLCSCLTSAALDADAKSSLIDAMGCWTEGGQLRDEARARMVDVLTTSLAQTGLVAAAAKALSKTASTIAQSPSTSQVVLSALTAVMENPASRVGDIVVSTEAATSLVAHGCVVPSALPGQWVRLCEEGGALMKHADAMLFKKGLRLHLALCRATPSHCRLVLDRLYATVWKYLSDIAPDAMGSTQEGLVAIAADLTALLLHAVPSEEQRFQSTVLHFIMEAPTSAMIKIRAVAVRALLGTDDGPVPVEGIVKVLAEKVAEGPAALLCLGEVGSRYTLGDQYADLLLEGVCNDSSEITRWCSEQGLCLAIANPGNATLLSNCLARATSGGRGHFYCLRALEGACALRRADSAFSDAKTANMILKALLQQSDEAEFEAAAKCIGGLTHYVFDDVVEQITRMVCCTDDAATVPLVCVSALRYALLLVAGSDKNVAQLKDPFIVLTKHFNRAASVQLRTALIRLVIAATKTHPQWLLDERARTFFPNFIVEMEEDRKLIVRISLDGYSHRDDKGLECRKMVFDCLSCFLGAEEKCGVNIMDQMDIALLLDALINSVDPSEKGERDPGINDEAKVLLVRLLRLRQNIAMSDEQVARLSQKLSEGMATADDPKADVRISVLYSLYAVTELSKNAFLHHHREFSKVSQAARVSPHLAAALQIRAVRMN